MDVLSLKEMVAREDEAFLSGVTAMALMEAAGEAMAQRIVSIYPRAEKYLVLIGKGNNGGDGLVVARHLISTGRPLQVVLTAPEDLLGDLPRTRLDLLRSLAPDLEIIPWDNELVFPGTDGVVIDALLGIQARGALRGTLHDVIPKLNAARAAQFFRTVALDLPTGLAAFEEIEGPHDRDDAVIADVTLAVGFAKEVLCREALSDWVGRLEIIPWTREPISSATRQVLVGPELAGLLPRRRALSHKGDFGRVVIVAGHLGFTGAPVLCAQAAQAMGAGLLSVITRPDASSTVAAQAPPEAMVSSWPEKGHVPEVARNATAIAIGPGLGVDLHSIKMLGAVLAVGCPVVIDADGLTALAQKLDLLETAKGPALLTPHPGEMARLIGRKFTDDEREAVARAFTERYNVTLVLKGTRTVIAARGHPIFINTTGNPGLSTGGSGDTLTGILAALLAQGLAPLDAARLGVWLHGHAADLVLAHRGCEEGLTPSMLSARLGEALVSLRAQAVPNMGLLEIARNYPGLIS
jgi:NAD(P)H-hydrate epimerase